MANIAADSTVVSARDPSCQLFITSSVEVTSLLRRRVVSLTDDSFERYLLNGEERCQVPVGKALVDLNSQVVNENYLII